MELATIVGDLISTVGFPIGAYLISMYMIDKKDKIIIDMIEKYGTLAEGLNNNTEAIKNLTVSITHLIEKTGDKE